MEKIFSARNTQVEDSPVARFVFGSTAFSIVWLLVRVWLGWQWISAAEHKLTDPKWVQTGEALKGFWVNALKTDPRPVISFDWYRSFIQMMVDTGSYTWFAKVVAFGELAIGVGLIIGAFVGVAAFFGAFMNWNFMMAGTASTNPLLFVAAILLILAWKTAGYYGVDRVLLPLLGTPWKPGFLIRRPEQQSVPPQPVIAQ